MRGDSHFLRRYCNMTDRPDYGKKIRRPTMPLTDDLSSILAALASCAIEGNALAIELLELQKTDPKEFMKRLIKEWYLYAD